MKRPIFSLAMLFFLAVPADATLIGDYVVGELLYPDTGTVFDSHNMTVTADDSDAEAFGGILVDVNALSVTYTALLSGLFAAGSGASACNCVVLTSLDIGFPITGFLVGSYPSGLTPSDIQTSANGLLVDLQGVTMALDDKFTVTLVPEPATVSLLAAGLAGLGAAVRRRRQESSGGGQP